MSPDEGRVIRLIDALPADAWDELVLGLSRPHLLQSRTWGDLKARWGWQCRRLAWQAPPSEAGPQAGQRRIVAAGQVLVRRIGRLPLRVGYVSKGPLVDQPSAWGAVLTDLARIGRRAGLTFIKMDPDVAAGNAALTDLWRRMGWQPSPEQIQFPNTMVSDLAGGEAAVLAAMKPKTRYNIRLAAEHGVVVHHPDAPGIGALYDLYVQTGERAGFGLRSRAYYEDAWSALLGTGRAALFVADLDGRPLAGAFCAAFGDTAWYLYGASANVGRETMASYAVQWACLRWAIHAGCRAYDWWGGATRLEATDPLWGVHRFKAGFGAEWRQQSGAWDLPLRTLSYRTYMLADRWRRKTIVGRGV